MKYFIFLEFTDSEVNNLLSGLRAIFSDEIPTTSIHLTIQGPLKSELSPTDLATLKVKFDLALKLNNDCLKFSDVKFFKFSKEIHVALGLECESLRSIWHKPDFPDEFNPHITLYSGSDSERASAIVSFLEGELISFCCHDYIFTQYRSSTPQRQLFSTISGKYSDKLFPSLVADGKVTSGILERAVKLVRPYKKKAKRKADLNALAQEAEKIRKEFDRRIE